MHFKRNEREHTVDKIVNGVRMFDKFITTAYAL
jgi:hypothetical protein